MKRHLLKTWSKILNLLCLGYRHASIVISFNLRKFSAVYTFQAYVKYHKTGKILSDKIKLNCTYVVLEQRDQYYCIVKYVFLVSANSQDD